MTAVDYIDIVPVVGETVALTRVGTSLKGCCPFCAGDEPSFYVHPRRQMFKCFRCVAGGDAVAFVMRRDGCSTREAEARLVANACFRRVPGTAN